jgi:hypothetical protein
MRSRLVLFVFLLVAGLSYWLWGATRPAHDGGHGPPLTVSRVSDLAVGTFKIEGGRERDVARAGCRAGADGAGIEPATHFRCDLRFVNGERDTVVVHVLPDGLLFKSNLR